MHQHKQLMTAALGKGDVGNGLVGLQPLLEGAVVDIIRDIQHPTHVGPDTFAPGHYTALQIRPEGHVDQAIAAVGNGDGIEIFHFIGRQNLDHRCGEVIEAIEASAVAARMDQFKLLFIDRAGDARTLVKRIRRQVFRHRQGTICRAVQVGTNQVIDLFQQRML